MTLRRVRVSGVAAILAAALAACSFAACSADEEQAGGAAGALEKATGVPWIVRTDEGGVVTFAAPKNGPHALSGVGSLEDRTRAFLAAQRAVFSMHDPAAELAFERTDRATDGSAHVRFQQRVGAVPVGGAVWYAHFDAASRLASMSGRYVPAAHDVSTTPITSESAAASTATAEGTRRAPGATFTVRSSSLEVLAVRGAAPALTWVVEVASTGTTLAAYRVHVDAKTGAVARVADRVGRGMATARAPQTHPPFEVATPDLSFPVSDDDPPRLVGRLPNDFTVRVTSYGTDADIVATSVNPWTDAVTPPGAAAAAMAHTATVLQYFGAHEYRGAPFVLRREPDEASTTLPVYVNDYRRGDVNAFWNYTDRDMHFGDGSPDDGIYPLSASLDTVAHELGHGVMGATAALEVGVDGTDSIALAESLGDVFASLVGHRVRNDDAVDFTLGEDLSVDLGPARSMIQPTVTSLLEGGGPSEMAALRAGQRESHRDSNVPSHAFYLMTHGGTHAVTKYAVPCGIGWDAADRLTWRVMTEHMTPTESFDAYALHTLAAARELGINERPIACAWVAVGVMTEDQARSDWNVTCEKDPGDGGTDADASDNVLVTTPARLVECAQPLTGPGVSLTP